MKSSFEGFPPEALKFLRQLKRNNNRDWFLAHKDVYEQKVKAPMTDLVMELGYQLQQTAPELNVNPKLRRKFRYRRSKQEINARIGQLMEAGLSGLVTRFGAWCAGYISDDEFDHDIELEKQQKCDTKMASQALYQ